MVSYSVSLSSINQSQVRETFEQRHFRMDGYHVAFGEVISGWDILDKLEELGQLLRKFNLILRKKL